MGNDDMIVAGIGFRASATQKSLQSAYDSACHAAKIHGVDALASVAEKTASPVMQKFALDKSLPIQSVMVSGIETPTQSNRVQALFGTGSLAEAAALVAAGPNARLICPRITSLCGRVTLAIAHSQEAL
jgi:cobalt-precorrin 5A hydrolase